MPPALVCYHLTTAPDVLLHAYLNDLPVFRGPHRGPETQQGGANHWLVPGENTLTLDVLRAPRPRSTGAPPGEPIRFVLFTAADPVHAPKDVTIIHEVRFSEIIERTPEAEHEPYHYTARFDLGVPVNAPVYLSSPMSDVDCRGTPELHQAIADLHASLAAGDVDRFLDLCSLRNEEYVFAYEGLGPTVDSLRDVARGFFASGPIVEPLEPDALHFEARALGRVVCVSRADGRSAIEARTRDDEAAVLRVDPWLTRKDGAWRIFG
ncbi:hypothetical protein [Polyangium sorediatum]|uniref:SnoaL-like domain-containing protein n=1 Tax=Polyangium sorediatum TaxID=889274 RepID=A0ABT6P9M5_9BACT|nr:hypothetical protein [Polyangium sorediatum]MDI1437281.1 hypothetical protein [Polyangium sorediatum]